AVVENDLGDLADDGDSHRLPLLHWLTPFLSDSKNARSIAGRSLALATRSPDTELTPAVRRARGSRRTRQEGARGRRGTRRCTREGPRRAPCTPASSPPSCRRRGG